MNEKIKDLIRYEFVVTVMVLAFLFCFSWRMLSDSDATATLSLNVLGGSAFFAGIPAIALMFFVLVSSFPSYHQDKFLVAFAVVFFCLSLMMMLDENPVSNFLGPILSTFGVIFIFCSCITVIKDIKRVWAVIISVLGQFLFFWLVVGLLYYCFK